MKYRRQRSDEVGPLLPRRRRRGLGVVPTLFTLGNCLCGFASLRYAAEGLAGADAYTQPATGAAGPVLTNYAIAAYLIFLAMVFDMFDGFMARLTKTTSDFGAELDSLADMVSFGVAPAYLALRLTGDLLKGERGGYSVVISPGAGDDIGRLFWLIGAIYVCCAALRLARFNVINKHDVDSHMNFRGLPSPGAAGVVVSTILFFEALHSSQHVVPWKVPASMLPTLKQVFPYVLPVVVLAAALLMVSRFAYAHLINRFLRGRRRFSYVVRVVIVAMLVWWQPQLVALLAIYIYALSAPAAWLWRTMLGKQPAPKQVAAPEPPKGPA